MRSWGRSSNLIVEKVSAASGSTPVFSKIDYSMCLLSHLPIVLTLLHLYRGCLAQSRQARAAAILNVHLETSDEKARRRRAMRRRQCRVLRRSMFDEAMG